MLFTVPPSGQSFGACYQPRKPKGHVDVNRSSRKPARTKPVAGSVGASTSHNVSSLDDARRTKRSVLARAPLASNESCKSLGLTHKGRVGLVERVRKNRSAEMRSRLGMEQMTTSVLAASGGIKQVICINWGTKYGAPFINRLYAMVARNITPPFTFTCFTDNRAGLNPEILCEDLPPLEVANMPTNTRGIWPKARLWGPTLGKLKGPVLFLDLDLVIVSSLDPFFDIGEADGVVMARNQTTPFERLGQTSLFRFPVGKLVPLQEKFRSDPQGVADEYRYEQRFVSRNAPGGITFFPRKWVLHFRQDCRWPFPLNYFLAPRLPSDARVIIFPRGLHPQHAIEGRYGTKGPRKNALEHIAGVFDPKQRKKKGALQYLRHYILPTPWVAEHWRE